MTLLDANFSALVAAERREETESILSENMATNIAVHFVEANNIAEPYRIGLGRGSTINLHVPSFRGEPVLHNLSVETARRIYLELRTALLDID